VEQTSELVGAYSRILAMVLLHIHVIDYGCVFVANECLILRGVDIGERVCVETFARFVFSELLLNNNGSCMQHYQHLSLRYFTSLVLLFHDPDNIGHVELCILLNLLVLHLVHCLVAIAAWVTDFVEILCRNRNRTNSFSREALRV